MKTTAAEHELEVLIYATGFDAVTGPLTRIDIRGEGGITIQEKWEDGPRTFLGLQSVGFPNLFTILGPTNGGSFCNLPRCIEDNVEMLAELLRTMREKGLTRIEPTQAAEDEWVEHVADTAKDLIITKAANSWFVGANTPGKPRVFLLYAGGPKVFRERWEGIVANGYEGFTMS